MICENWHGMRDCDHPENSSKICSTENCPKNKSRDKHKKRAV